MGKARANVAAASTVITLMFALLTESALGQTPITTTFASGNTIDVTSLRRTDGGATLTLSGVYNNKSSRGISVDVGDISFIDFKNLKKYLVIRDSSNGCICSTPGYTEVGENSSMRFWAKFPAPPEAVTSLSLVWGSAEPTLIPVTN